MAINKFILKKITKTRPLVCLTAYNTYIAKIIDDFCDIILVGDSLGMVLYGENTTRKVTIDMMISHGKAVKKGIKKSIFVIDMPIGTYEKSPAIALKNATKIINMTGCDAVKLEGGVEISKTIRNLVKNKISVMAHIGLQPQKIKNPKNYRVKGKLKNEEIKIINDYKAIEKSGAFSVVIETVTEKLANYICGISKIPVIGIGASNKCDGQILVTEDLLGFFNKTPRFVKKYENLRKKIKEAVKKYRKEVINRKFPSKKNLYN